ncbi:MAG: lactoylglutathione lyase [Methylobacterium sp.]|nr:MAG: lactoylglutathione lyase [Methylobacterium sp.]
MEFLHTMIRIRNIEESLKFFCDGLGLVETRRIENEKGRFTLIFLAAPGDVEHARTHRSKELELTFNWDDEEYKGGRNFGHVAYRVDNIYDTCAHLQKQGITILRPPREGRMAFVKSPDGISVELLQKGDSLPVAEPWASMPNTGSW